MLRTCEGIQAFAENESQISAAVNLDKCLKQINLTILHHNCTPISELPSNISTIYLLLLQ